MLTCSDDPNLTATSESDTNDILPVVEAAVVAALLVVDATAVVDALPVVVTATVVAALAVVDAAAVVEDTEISRILLDFKASTLARVEGYTLHACDSGINTLPISVGKN